MDLSVRRCPAKSESGAFGDNSNRRGPVSFPRLSADWIYAEIHRYVEMIKTVVPYRFPALSLDRGRRSGSRHPSHTDTGRRGRLSPHRHEGLVTKLFSPRQPSKDLSGGLLITSFAKVDIYVCTSYYPSFI